MDHEFATCWQIHRLNNTAHSPPGELLKLVLPLNLPVRHEVMSSRTGHCVMNSECIPDNGDAFECKALHHLNMSRALQPARLCKTTVRSPSMLEAAPLGPRDRSSYLSMHIDGRVAPSLCCTEQKFRNCSVTT
jgi:hypothetical protein